MPDPDSSVNLVLGASHRVEAGLLIGLVAHREAKVVLLGGGILYAGLA